MGKKTLLQKRAKKNQKLSMLSRHSAVSVLKRFLYMTEKAQSLLESNTYCFEVAMSANKNDIKVAIEQLYEITPDRVRTVTQPQKNRMQRGLVRKKTKKAYIILPEDKQLSIS